MENFDFIVHDCEVIKAQSTIELCEKFKVKDNSGAQRNSVPGKIQIDKANINLELENMETYLERFEAMARELDNHPDIELLNFERFPPLSETELAMVESAVGNPLDPSILSFFKASNGLQLLWVHKKNEDYDPDTFRKFDGPLNQPEHRDSFLYSDGCINIHSLRDIFVNGDWEDIIWRESQSSKSVTFRGEDWNQMELMKRIYPFDVYSESACMAFLVSKDGNHQDVLLAKDYYIEIDGSRITDFPSYLEFLLATKGAVPYRSRNYGSPQGHRQGLLVTPREYWNETNSYSLESPPEW